MVCLMYRLIQKKKAEENGRRDRTIVICPPTLMDQWYDELTWHIAGLKVLDLQSIKVNYVPIDKIVKADVILTTSTAFWELCGKENRKWDDYAGEYYHQYITPLTKSEFLLV